MTIRRFNGTHPGFDCTVTCEHDPPGDHGVSGGTWWYAVSNGERAVSISVLANDYPPSVKRPLIPILENVSLATLCWHQADPDGSDCDWVTGGKCRCDTSSIQGHAFWKEHADPTRASQSEAFWLALEAELEEFRASEGLGSMLKTLAGLGYFGPERGGPGVS